MTVPVLPQHKLFLALYIRDHYIPSIIENEDRYHWALLAIPALIASSADMTKATRFHIRDYYSGPDQTHWIYEEIPVNAAGTPKLLAQIPIGDIRDMETLIELVRNLPIVQQVEGWNCVAWIESALKALEEDGEAVSATSDDLSWLRLRNVALRAADAETFRRSAKTEKIDHSVWEQDFTL